MLACAGASRAWTASSWCPRPSPARSSCPASSASRLWLAGTTRHESLLPPADVGAWPPDLASLICTWRTASSRSFLRGADRRRRLRAARTSGASRRAVLLLLAEWRGGFEPRFRPISGGFEGFRHLSIRKNHLRKRKESRLKPPKSPLDLPTYPLMRVPASKKKPTRAVSVKVTWPRDGHDFTQH